MSPPSLTATRDSVKPAQWRLKVTFWLDVSLVVVVCALPVVPFTGLVIHEWLGIAIVGMVLAHLLLAWSWIASQSRRFFFTRSIRDFVNYIINLGLYASFVAAVVSGILISQKAVPTLMGTGPPPHMNWRWDTIHYQSAGALGILSALHLAMNWDWSVAAAQKIFSRFLEGAR